MARAKNTHAHIDRDSQDAFGYREYIEPLAQQLFDGQDGFTLGIFGGWGQGKTSLMKLLHARVAMRKVTVLPIWFDAWKFDRADVVWRALLAQTVNDIERRLDDVLKGLDKEIRKLDVRPVAETRPDPERVTKCDELQAKREALETWRKDELEPLKHQLYRSFTRTEKDGFRVDLTEAFKLLGLIGIQTVLPGSNLISRLWKGIRGIQTSEGDSADNVKEDVKAFGRLLDLIRQQESETYFEHIRYLEQFQDNLHRLIDQARERLGTRKKMKIIFFIDDLDRCEPDKAIEVLEAVKLFLSTPNTVFVIGVDDEVIHAGLQRRYGDWLQRLEESAESAGLRAYHLEYLEKIVQLPFTLPALPEDDITRYVRERLSPELQDDLVVQVIKLGCQYNPRKLNRTCHLFNLNWEIAKQRELNERIAPVILAKLVIIQLRHRALFRLLLEGITAIPRQLEEHWRAETVADPSGAPPEGRETVQAAADDETPIPADSARAPPDRRESIIKPFIGLDWLREMLMWQPRNREQLRKADSHLCITFDDLARSQHYRINEHIELKPVERGHISASGRLAISGRASLTGDAILVKLDQEVIRELLHKDLAVIESACDSISPDDRGDYAKHLLKLLEDPATPWRQRVSAGDALGFLGDPRFAEGREHWVEIPAGEFYRGSRKADYSHTQEDEFDDKRHRLDAFAIGRYPVTNAEYRRFFEATDHEPPRHWREGAIPLGKDNHPVVAVSWHDANAYIAWLNERDDGHDYAVPTEAQWERAARGSAKVDDKENRRIYPWGDTFDPHRCNVRETGLGRTTAVGCFPDGASPDGVLDMSGNVWEWCLNNYDNPGQTTLSGTARRVARGGSWTFDQSQARVAVHIVNDPVKRDLSQGFRVVRCPSIRS